MLSNVEIRDGQLVFWDHNGRQVLELPLPMLGMLGSFDLGKCATEILTFLLAHDDYKATFPLQLAATAAKMAKKIRDVLLEEFEHEDKPADG